MDFKAVKVHCANLHGSLNFDAEAATSSAFDWGPSRCFGEVTNHASGQQNVLDPRTTLAILQHVSTAVCDQLYRSLAVYSVSESQACTECNQKLNGSQCLRTIIAIQCTYCRRRIYR